MNEAEVEIHLRLSDDGQMLDVFLHHPDPEGQLTLETFLLGSGADVITYPCGVVPPEVEGVAFVADSTISILIGPLHVVGAMDITTDRAESAKRAVLYVLPKPFCARDRNEKQLVAATLPLEIEKGRTA